MKNRIVVAFVALLLVTGVAIAQVVKENYAEVKLRSSTSLETGAPTFVSTLSTLDGTDSTTWSTTTPLTGRCFLAYGDGTLMVIPRHSAASATACVVVGLRDRANGFHGIAGIQTSTAGDGLTNAYDGTGYYGTPLFFPLVGWAKYEVRVYDASGSSTVSLKCVTVGATGAAAE